MIQFLNSLTIEQGLLVGLVLAIVIMAILCGLSYGIPALWVLHFPKHEWSEVQDIPVRLSGVTVTCPEGSEVKLTIKGRYCLKCGKSIQGSTLSENEEYYYRTHYKCIKNEE
jgi:hypothetical protein